MANIPPPPPLVRNGPIPNPNNLTNISEYLINNNGGRPLPDLIFEVELETANMLQIANGNPPNNQNNHAPQQGGNSKSSNNSATKKKYSDQDLMKLAQISVKNYHLAAQLINKKGSLQSKRKSSRHSKRRIKWGRRTRKTF